MANLTAAQATELAKNFLSVSESIADFRFNNWKSLSKDENKRLSDLHDSILKNGENMLAQSTTLVMDEIQSSLSKINGVTSDINVTIKKLKNIQKGIDIAASVAAMGSAILSRNPQSIFKAIGGLSAAVKENS